MNYSRLIDSVKKHEGYRDRVYVDTLGYQTIGYGFAIKDLRLEKDISGIILERKLMFLIGDLYTRHQWIIEMPSKIQEVIVEMCYQLGVGGFSKFKKTIGFLKKGDFGNAGEEMLDSRWRKQTKTRCEYLAKLMKECA